MKKFVWLLGLTTIVGAAGFAPDQRHLAPTQSPFTALARTQAHGGVGCGVLIGPDLVLTCAHCVADPKRQLYDDVEIEFGLGFESTSHKARVKEAYLAENASAAIDAGQDWALLRLDRPLGAYYGWLDCKFLSDAEWPEAEVELLGYCACPDEQRPQFGRMDRPYRCPGAVSDIGPQIVFHNCAMWGGTSGAPLLAKEGSNYTVVGLNFAGVDIEDEKLQHGFRETYRKELANLAIPARNWQSKLQEIPPAPEVRVRTASVLNRSKKPLQVAVRYHSVFARPGDPVLENRLTVAPGERQPLVTREQGCTDSSITLQINKEKKPLILKLTADETVLEVH